MRFIPVNGVQRSSESFSSVFDAVSLALRSAPEHVLAAMTRSAREWVRGGATDCGAEPGGIHHRARERIRFTPRVLSSITTLRVAAHAVRKARGAGGADPDPVLASLIDFALACANRDRAKPADRAAASEAEAEAEAEAGTGATSRTAPGAPLRARDIRALVVGSACASPDSLVAWSAVALYSVEAALNARVVVVDAAAGAAIRGSAGGHVSVPMPRVRAGSEHERGAFAPEFFITLAAQPTEQEGALADGGGGAGGGGGGGGGDGGGRNDGDRLRRARAAHALRPLWFGKPQSAVFGRRDVPRCLRMMCARDYSKSPWYVSLAVDLAPTP